MNSVAVSTSGDKLISTIGIGHLPYPLRSEHLFETAVFGSMGNIAHTERYDTEEEALEGHDRILAELEAGTFEPNGLTWVDLKNDV